MASFIATAIITLVVTIVDIFCRMSLSCKKYLYSKHLGNEKEDIKKLLRKFQFSTSQKWRSNEQRHPLAKLELVMSKSSLLVGSLIGHAALPIIVLFSNEYPKARRFAKLALDILCDIQVTTGTAIIISGFARLQSMSYYHQRFIVSYWYLALNSYWAARAGVLHQDIDEQKDSDISSKSSSNSNSSSSSSSNSETWHFWTRTAAIFCCLVLSAMYQLLVYLRQSRDWSPVKEGKCYLSNERPLFPHQWLWLAGTAINAVYLGLVMLVGLLWRDLSFLKDLSTKTSTLRVEGRRWFKSVRNRWMDGKHPLLQFLIYIFFTLPLTICYVTSIIVDILTWGDSNSVILVLFYSGFVGWNISSIIELKVANAELMDEGEWVWGFGQVLAVGLLGLVLLNCGDAWKGMY